MRKQDLTILLVQFRNSIVMKEHEREHVARSARVPVEQIKVLDAITEPMLDGFYNEADLIVLGGSGEYSIFADLPCMQDLRDWLNRALAENKPVLGSCLGAQFMAEFLGGKVVTEEARYEIGTLPVKLTDAAETDPLFHDFPKTFLAQIGHHQTVVEVPPGAEVLAQTDKAIHAFAWPGKKLYAMQFHPELTKDSIIERITHCKDEYASQPGEYERVVNAAKDSPYTDYIISDYIERVVLMN